jgi:hypothetical protein
LNIKFDTSEPVEVPIKYQEPLPFAPVTAANISKQEIKRADETLTIRREDVSSVSRLSA